jgi:transposase InsO family protein
VAWACDAREVSESGSYAGVDRTPSPAEQWRDRLVAAIAQVHAEGQGRYGSPRMTAEWNARGYDCTENTVAHLMKTHGIRAKAVRRFVRVTDSRHPLPVAENLLGRDFAPPGPHVALVGGHHGHPDGGRLAGPGRRGGPVQPDARR